MIMIIFTSLSDPQEFLPLQLVYTKPPAINWNYHLSVPTNLCLQHLWLQVCRFYLCYSGGPFSRFQLGCWLCYSVLYYPRKCITFVVLPLFLYKDGSNSWVFISCWYWCQKCSYYLLYFYVFENFHNT